MNIKATNAKNSTKQTYKIIKQNKQANKQNNKRRCHSFHFSYGNTTLYIYIYMYIYIYIYQIYI